MGEKAQPRLAPPAHVSSFIHEHPGLLGHFWRSKRWVQALQAALWPHLPWFFPKVLGCSQSPSLLWCLCCFPKYPSLSLLSTQLMQLSAATGREPLMSSSFARCRPAPKGTLQSQCSELQHGAAAEGAVGEVLQNYEGVLL